MVVVRVITNSSMNNSRNFRMRFPINVFSLPRGLPAVGLHLPLPSFSVSRQSLLFAPNELKVGNDDSSFRLDREKNPSFLVEKLGYPITASLLAFAEAHVTPLELPFVFPYLDGECSFKPGVDQPPSGRGDGERDNDIVPDSGSAGVPGMGDSVCVKARVGSPDEAPWLWSLAELPGEVFSFEGRPEEERRRECVKVEVAARVICSANDPQPQHNRCAEKS